MGHQGCTAIEYGAARHGHQGRTAIDYGAVRHGASRFQCHRVWCCHAWGIKVAQSYSMVLSGMGHPGFSAIEYGAVRHGA